MLSIKQWGSRRAGGGGMVVGGWAEAGQLARGSRMGGWGAAAGHGANSAPHKGTAPHRASTAIIRQRTVPCLLPPRGRPPLRGPHAPTSAAAHTRTAWHGCRCPQRAHLQLCLCGVLAQRPHHSAQLLCGDGALQQQQTAARSGKAGTRGRRAVGQSRCRQCRRRRPHFAWE